MATIDLIVLGMLRKEALSAYDIQKQVEYRNISRWVKISTPSIYKKVIKLEEKGYIKSNVVKEGKMAEKAVYSLTSAGKKEFEKPYARESKTVPGQHRGKCKNSEGLSGRKYRAEGKPAGDSRNRQGCAAAAVYTGRGHRGLDRHA